MGELGESFLKVLNTNFTYHFDADSLGSLT